MPKGRAAQVASAKGPYEVVEREVASPGPGQVRIRVQASGICHSDSLTRDGLWPGITYPRVPGHEVAGVVDAVGSEVEGFAPGDRVGVGWHGGHCGRCERCRRGDFVFCVEGRVPGIAYDGGHADYMIAPSVALARIPEGLTAQEAAPLMCAGVTTYNSLRNAGARPGDIVAVLGLGGLGHLGVQYAARSGYRTVAIARGTDKEKLARQLGAEIYVDSEKQDPAQELARLGGARVVLATVTSARAMSAVLGGLGYDGRLVVLGAPHEPLEVPGVLLISGRRSVAGWASGNSIDSEDAMAFSARFGVRSMNEVFPLDRASEAYERMMSGKARFRVVLTTGA
jgi:D-arabinose 1-dehydrogenase-like Zn-dependent alcohol dehydrogenase